VLINTNSTLGSTAVKAIAQSVSGAVPGLGINRVTITDQDGDLLWPGSGTSGTSALTARQSSEQAYDTQTAEEADAYLDATIGPNKALVQLNADLNTNTQTVSSVTYGKTKVPLTQTTGNEKLNGNPNAVNAAGNTATKIASVAGTSTTGNTNYTNDTNTVSNGVNKTVSQTNVAPGSIIRQGISVLVNSTVPASEIPAIKAAVENSVGFVKSRGDTIAVNAVTFAKVPSIAKSSSKPLGDVKYVLVGLGSLLFLLFIARLLRKRENDNFAGNPTWLRELEYPRSLAEIESTQMVDLEGPAVVARLRPPVNVARQQVEDLVDRDPERVAAQIRQWMTED
jgi:flagellar M-ring protein FliF